MTASEWPEVRLGDVIELKRGYDLPRQERRPGPFAIVSSSGVTGRHAVAKVPGPGVVTGRYGTIGEVFYVEADFWPLNTTLYVCDFKGNDPRFVCYFLRMFDFDAYSDKAAVPGVNRNHLHEARVRFPQLAQQQAIASILGALDHKIELNRRMSDTAEATDRAIFKSWFEDFDPARAKSMGGRQVGAAAETTALPTGSFDDSRTRPIPDGWTVCRLGMGVSITRDVVDPQAFPGEVFNHYSIPAFDNGGRPSADLGRGIKKHQGRRSRRGCPRLEAQPPNIPRLAAGGGRRQEGDCIDGVRRLCGTASVDAGVHLRIDVVPVVRGAPRNARDRHIR